MLVVSFKKQNNKYQASLVFKKKQIHIGFFNNEIEAAKAYNEKALELNNESKTKYKLNNL